MDTGRVATQWGHTTDLRHFGKMSLLRGGGRSSSGTAPFLGPQFFTHLEAPLAP